VMAMDADEAAGEEGRASESLEMSVSISQDALEDLSGAECYYGQSVYRLVGGPEGTASPAARSPSPVDFRSRTPTPFERGGAGYSSPPPHRGSPVFPDSPPLGRSRLLADYIELFSFFAFPAICIFKSLTHFGSTFLHRKLWLKFCASETLGASVYCEGTHRAPPNF
jgi:hypothetical protein